MKLALPQNSHFDAWQGLEFFFLQIPDPGMRGEEMFILLAPRGVSTVDSRSQIEFLWGSLWFRAGGYLSPPQGIDIYS